MGWGQRREPTPERDPRDRGGMVYGRGPAPTRPPRRDQRVPVVPSEDVPSLFAPSTPTAPPETAESLALREVAVQLGRLADAVERLRR